jgi:CHAT domain-containing protein
LLSEAEARAVELAAAGGDAMLRDEARLIRRAEAAGDVARLRELALGHDGYGGARASYVANRQEEAADLMSQAARHFSRAGSAYASWAPIFKAIFLRNNGEPQHAINALADVPLEGMPAAYHHLRGRLEWTEGVALDALGRFDLGRERLTRAVHEFQVAGEDQNVIATRTILAEAKGFLGDRASAWDDMIAVFQDSDRRGSTRRNYHFWVGATLALGAGLPEAALELQNARLRVVENPRDRAEAFLHRARTLAMLGDRSGALNDLNQATGAVAALDDRALRDRNAADARIVRADVLRVVDGRAALEDADAALAYVRRADPAIRLAELFMLRAKCREALNDVRGAEEDLIAAVETFERKRSTLTTAQDRMQAFEQERSAFKDLVRLEIVTRGNESAALRIAERARAGVLLENWTGTLHAPVDPAVAYRDIPQDIAIVYYETLPDRVLGWVITRDRCVHFTRPISFAALGNMVARIQRVIRDGADLDGLRPHTAALYDALVAPALDLAGAKPTVFFVPDGPLFLVPFGALPDALGRPLIATRTVGIAPSLTTFLAASARLAHFRADDVLAVGDGHDPAVSGLPRLPHADEEATAVGGLYPTRLVLIGPAATRHRMLEERHAVIHFAGHTIVNLQFPLFSRMLLAPDSGDRDSGAMMASEITHDRFAGARVVVLATCEGAAGKLLEGEGVISIARAFFGAGVPSVVASLWPVDDDSHGLLTAFHRELRNSADAARALRVAQLARVRDGGPRIPVRAWAGFVALGGTTPAI